MKVIYKFADLKDKGHVYNIGDKYPRVGYKPTKERVEELSGSDNRIGKPLIVAEVNEVIEIEPEEGAEIEPDEVTAPEEGAEIEPDEVTAPEEGAEIEPDEVTAPEVEVEAEKKPTRSSKRKQDK